MRRMNVLWQLTAIMVLALTLSTLSGCRRIGGPQMYVGRTTLIEASTLRPSAKTADIEKRLNTLVTMATSQKVMSEVADELSNLGLSVSPDVILSSTKVTRVHDTNVVAVEVTLPSPSDAKVAADVVAIKVKNAYSDLCAATLTEERELLEKQYDEAVDEAHRVHMCIDDYKIQYGDKADPKQLAELDTEWKAAEKKLATIDKKLDEVRLEEELAKKKQWLKTLDPAYIYVAK